ncbi:MAG: hypothetical protein JNG89_02985, partial [Planctomycetaceae bacterium]|nr:hypothetical protein [Planctomycetaceae bacterium]
MSLPLELTRPMALIALLAMPVLVYYFVRSLSDFPRPQRIVSLVARSIVALLIILSLAGLTWLHSVHDQYVIFLVDDSLSIGDEAAAQATKYLDEIGKDTGENKLARLSFHPAPGAFVSLRVGEAPPEPLPQQDVGTSPARQEPRPP